VIVNDFIDMRDEKHRRGVEKALKDAIKRDRARTKVLRTSAFGIIEMTRQRIRPSLKRSVYQDCPHCLGQGQVKTCESMSIEVMRMLQLAAHKDNVARINVRVADDVAHYLQNKKRKEIARLEEGSIQVQIQGALGVPPETLDFVCFDSNNNEVRFLNYDDRGRRR
jgi:ribonuclease E